MASEQTEETQGRLRRLNMDIVSGSIAAVGSLLIATDAQAWGDAVLMGVGLAMTMTVVRWWTIGRHLRLIPVGLAVVAAVNSRLTQERIVALNAEVTDGRPDVDVARQFLRDQGLLTPLRPGAG
jgi:hypothetical protein